MSKTEPEPADQSRPPRASLCHQTDRRFRVRIPEGRRDEAYLEGVREGLNRHPSVVRVETTALTGSVLVSHRGELPEILAFAKSAGLFAVDSAEGHDPTVIRWLDALDRFDTDVLFPRLDASPQRAATGLFMLAVLQVLRGSVLPSAPSLLGEAMALLRKVREESKSRDRDDT